MEGLWREDDAEERAEKTASDEQPDQLDFWDDILAAEAAAIEAGDEPFTFSEVEESEPTDEPGKTFRGGRYRDLPTETGRDRHHLVAAESLGVAELNPAEGLAIQMERSDHRQTASYGPYPEARAFRAEQTKLLLAGRSAEALAMGVLDVQVKFGMRYRQAIEEAIDATDR